MKFQLSPSSSGIIEGLRKTDWSRRSSYARLLSKISYAAKSPRNLLDEEWDYLLILDAARLDLFLQSIDVIAPELRNDVREITSLASTTIEWGYRTFDGRDTSKYGYITATPMYRRFEEYLDHPLQFNPLVDLSESDYFREYGTVPPHVVSDSFIEHVDSDSGTPYIVHYLQPHIPFISPEVDHPKIPAFVTSPSDRSAWELLEDGEISEKAVREAYLANHRYILQEILWLVGELPPNKNVLISSDHGNSLGGWHGYYGHGPGMYLSALVDVPALTLKTGTGYCSRPEKPEKLTHESSNMDSISDRLMALGYK